MEEKIEEGKHSNFNIEKIKREFKTHRNRIDIDMMFISHCFQKVNSEAERAAVTEDIGQAAAHRNSA